MYNTQASYATRTGYGGAGGAAFGATGGVPGAAGSLADPQRLWDLGNLQSKLNDMQFAIAAADEALLSSTAGGGGGGGGAYDGSTGGAYGGGAGDDGASNPNMAYGFDLTTLPVDELGAYLPVDPASMVDTSLLPVVEGQLHKKSETGLLRGWKSRWARLEGTELAFYERPDDRKPRSRLPLDARSAVEPGDTVKAGGGKGGGTKYDLVITNGAGGRVWVYLDTEEAAAAWMQTLHYVITRLQEADRLNGLIAANALPPVVDVQQAAAQQAAQQGATAGGGGGATRRFGATAGAGGSADGGDAGGIGGILGLSSTGSAGGDGSSSPDGAGGAPGELTPEQQRAADEAACHVAYGSGLYEGVRGEPATFFITAHDAPGVPRAAGGDIFSVSLDSDDLHFELVPVDNGDGSYTVEYTPTRSGDYALRVAYGGYDIFGSPFHPTVAKAPTAASHCVAVGAGTAVARVGATNEFVITARDQFDEPRGAGGDSFEVTIVGPGLANPIVDNGDGTYTVTYDVDEGARAYAAALEEGRPLGLEIHLTLCNEGFPYPRPIAGSPFRPKVAFPGSAVAAAAAAAAAAAVAPPSSVKPGAGSSGSASLGSPGRFSPAAAGGAGFTAAPGGGLADREAEVARARAEVDAKERALASSLAAVEALKAQVEADRAAVDKQMAVMAELGRRVKEDSERLAEQARALRAVAVVGGPAHQQQPQPQSQAAPYAASVSAPSPMPADVAALLAAAAAATGGARTGGGGSAPAASSSPLQPSTGGGGGFFSDNASVATAGTSATAAAAMAAVLAAASSGSGSDGGGGGAAPSELFEPDVMALFDKHKRALYALFSHYATASLTGDDGAGAGAAMDAKRFGELFADFDVAPTFLTRKELKALFAATAAAHGSGGAGAGGDGVLTYAGFIEALGRAALAALSKPAFTALYPTARDKVGVLLEMWGVADPRKLGEIARRPPAAAAVGGSGQKAAKRRA